MIHIVTYDLKSPNDTSEDYKRVIATIKAAFSSWCHIEQSVWLVETTMTAGDARDYIKTVLSSADILFVARLNGNWGSSNFGDQRNTWLKGRTF
jgi:hypothetical protein